MHVDKQYAHLGAHISPDCCTGRSTEGRGSGGLDSLAVKSKIQHERRLRSCSQSSHPVLRYCWNHCVANTVSVNKFCTPGFCTLSHIAQRPHSNNNMWYTPASNSGSRPFLRERTAQPRGIRHTTPARAETNRKRIRAREHSKQPAGGVAPPPFFLTVPSGGAPPAAAGPEWAMRGS